MPCFSGQTPQQMLALLALVTEGMTPATVFPMPRFCQPFSTGIGLDAM
jgi:hypothetical protein